MPDREDRFADGRLFYRVWDTERQAPKAIVVLAHGYAEHSGRYAHVAKKLVDAGYRAYALDHFGHGKSEGEVRGDIGTLESAVADLDAFIDLAVAENPGL